MNHTKSTSRPLPYPCLLSNTVPFASKMRRTFFLKLAQRFLEYDFFCVCVCQCHSALARSKIIIRASVIMKSLPPNATSSLL